MGFLMYLSKKENFPHNNKTYSYKLRLQQEEEKKKSPHSSGEIARERKRDQKSKLPNQ